MSFADQLKRIGKPLRLSHQAAPAKSKNEPEIEVKNGQGPGPENSTLPSHATNVQSQSQQGIQSDSISQSTPEVEALKEQLKTLESKIQDNLQPVQTQSRQDREDEMKKERKEGRSKRKDGKKKKKKRRKKPTIIANAAEESGSESEAVDVTSEADTPVRTQQKVPDRKPDGQHLSVMDERKQLENQSSSESNVDFSDNSEIYPSRRRRSSRTGNRSDTSTDRDSKSNDSQVISGSAAASASASSAASTSASSASSTISSSAASASASSTANASPLDGASADSGDSVKATSSTGEDHAVEPAVATVSASIDSNKTGVEAQLSSVSSTDAAIGDGDEQKDSVVPSSVSPDEEVCKPTPISTMTDTEIEEFLNNKFLQLRTDKDRLGVAYVQDKDSFGNSVLKITRVQSHSIAERHGVIAGDVVVLLNSNPPSQTPALLGYQLKARPLKVEFSTAMDSRKKDTRALQQEKILKQQLLSVVQQKSKAEQEEQQHQMSAKQAEVQKQKETEVRKKKKKRRKQSSIVDLQEASRSGDEDLTDPEALPQKEAPQLSSSTATSATATTNPTTTPATSTTTSTTPPTSLGTTLSTPNLSLADEFKQLQNNSPSSSDHDSVADQQGERAAVTSDATIEEPTHSENTGGTKKDDTPNVEVVQDGVQQVDSVVAATGGPSVTDKATDKATDKTSDKTSDKATDKATDVSTEVNEVSTEDNATEHSVTETADTEQTTENKVQKPDTGDVEKTDGLIDEDGMETEQTHNVDEDDTSDADVGTTMTNEQLANYLDKQKESSGGIRRQQQEQLLKRQLQELEKKTKRAQQQQLQQLKQLEQLKLKEKEQKENRMKKKKRKKRRKKPSIGSVDEQKTNGHLPMSVPNLGVSRPRPRSRDRKLSDSIVDNYATPDHVIHAPLSEENLGRLMDDSGAHHSPTHSIVSSISEFKSMNNYSSSDDDDEPFVHPLDRPDETFEVIKIHTTWKRSRRQIRLTRYHLENLRRGKTTHRHNYNDIKVVSLVANNKFIITIRNHPKLTYTSDIANFIVAQIDERLPIALSFDNVVTQNEILTGRKSSFVGSITSDTTSVYSVSDLSHHRRPSKAGQLFHVPQGVHHPTMPNFKLYIKNACNDYQVDANVEAFAPQKIGDFLISDYFDSSTISQHAKFNLSEPAKVLNEPSGPKKAGTENPTEPISQSYDPSSNSTSGIQTSLRSHQSTNDHPTLHSSARSIPESLIKFGQTPQSRDIASISFELRNQDSAELQECAGCGAAIRAEASKNDRRWCEYTGRFYCPECHYNDRSSIPSRLVHYLDVGIYPVCRRAKQYLAATYHQANIPRAYIKPALQLNCKPLQLLLQLQAQLSSITVFIEVCEDQTKLITILSSRHYFRYPAEYLSMRDYVEILAEDLCERVAQALTYFKQHIRLDCEYCAKTPVYCSECPDSSPLYGAQIPREMLCGTCGGCLKLYEENTC